MDTNQSNQISTSRPLPAQAACKSKVLWLDGNTLCVNGGEVGILKEGDKICFCRLLQCHDGRRLEAQVGLDTLSTIAGFYRWT